ncbi:MAG: hypothetical protein ILP22_12745 [Oscillospiraceae bacterium]|nr:hypothetical protein [Oscillospiraceae bacterium]
MNIKKATATILSAVLAFTSAGFSKSPGSIPLPESQTVNAADNVDSGWGGDKSLLSTDKINIILDQNVTGKPGETVRIDASIIDNNVHKVDTVQLRFNYDPRLTIEVVGDRRSPFHHQEYNSSCQIGTALVEEIDTIWLNENFSLYFLFTIPDDAEPGTVYDLTWEDIGQYEFNMFSTQIDEKHNYDCNFINGSIVVTAPDDPLPVAEPSPLPTANVTPSESVVQSILNTDPEKVKSPILDWNDKTVLENGDSIDVQINTQMAFTGDKQMEFDVMLSDFSPTHEYFDYAGLVFYIPDGARVAEIKTYHNCIVRKYNSDSTEALAFSEATGVKTQRHFYETKSSVFEFTGIDVSDKKKDIVLCTVVLYMPKNPRVVNKAGVSAVFGRLTEKTKFYDDGSVQPYVSIIDNGNNDIAYSETEFSVLTGLKGDVDLDEKVTQVDATFILRELLYEALDNKSILEEMIKDNVSGELADEDYVSLSRYLGDVSHSPQKRFSQTDATFILRALLEADLSGQQKITPEIWNSVLK